MPRTVARVALIALADTVTKLDARHVDAVLVTGSHGGNIAARYASNAHVRAVIFNDAGVGFESAGIAGLVALDAIGMAAAAVSHASARIADSRDSFANGVISHANAHARRYGVAAGMHCRDAASLLQRASGPTGVLDSPSESRFVLRKADDRHVGVIGVDSIGCLKPGDAGQILVIGSHGALHGGDPASALPLAAAAAFFHDAARGKDDVGVSRLPVLAERGISAGAVDYRTARIGDARSMWRSGIVSCANSLLAKRDIAAGERLDRAIERLLHQRT